MPAAIPSFQNFSMDASDGLDAFMAAASPRTKDRVRRLQNQFNTIHAMHDARRKRLDKIREEIGEVDRSIATIARDEERMGPLKRNVKSDDDKGSTLVVVDRIGPLKEKKDRLRAEYREVEAEVFPSAPGVNETWMASAAIRAQFDDEKLPTFKLSAKSTIKQVQEAAVADTDAAIARVKRIQRAPLPAQYWSMTKSNGSSISSPMKASRDSVPFLPAVALTSAPGNSRWIFRTGRLDSLQRA